MTSAGGHARHATIPVKTDEPVPPAPQRAIRRQNFPRHTSQQYQPAQGKTHAALRQRPRHGILIRPGSRRPVAAAMKASWNVSDQNLSGRGVSENSACQDKWLRLATGSYRSADAGKTGSRPKYQTKYVPRPLRARFANGCWFTHAHRKSLKFWRDAGDSRDVYYYPPNIPRNVFEGVPP